MWSGESESMMVRLPLLLLYVAALGCANFDATNPQHRETMRWIDAHNANPNKTFFMRFSEISALTHEQYQKLLGSLPEGDDYISGGSLFELPDNFTAPDSVDWRGSHLVSPVKNQGDCGSCWAFSAVGALEGQHAKKRGQLLEFSEQNLVDCSTENDGCDGGNAYIAFNYVHDNKGIDTEKSYPYHAAKQTCHFNRESVGETDEGYVRTPFGDEEALKNAIAAIGPIAVSIDASRPSFGNYGGGLYYEPSCASDRTNHAVLAVGYGTDIFGRDYWIIKNSWGASWGVGGYIYMARNRNNNCAIANKATYPIVN